MFTLISVTEYVVIALGAALLFGLCVFNALGALQQSGYAAKRYAHWLGRKGNMTRSRFTLLAFLIALSMLVLGIAFSFAGKWAGYVPLVSIPLFVSLYCVAERRALKVPLRGTARAKRVYALNLLVLAVLAFALIVGANALAYFTEVALISHLRYLPLALLPLLQPWLLVAANALEKPFSSARNKKYLKKAARILHEAKCVKIAITGSFAKTGVKSYLAQILSARYKVIATPESFNTPLGIARSVEKGLDCDFFIAEMGARHAGDIAELCELVQPITASSRGSAPSIWKLSARKRRSCGKERDLCGYQGGRLCRVWGHRYGKSGTVHKKSGQSAGRGARGMRRAGRKMHRKGNVFQAGFGHPTGRMFVQTSRRAQRVQRRIGGGNGVQTRYERGGDRAGGIPPRMRPAPPAAHPIGRRHRAGRRVQRQHPRGGGKPFPYCACLRAERSSSRPASWNWAFWKRKKTLPSAKS